MPQRYIFHDAANRGFIVVFVPSVGEQSVAFFWRQADAEDWDPIQPAPQLFELESGNFVVYDPNRFDPCIDRDCRCHQSRNNSSGFGSTPANAFADFWETWEARSK